jgi:hypothetical protein
VTAKGVPEPKASLSGGAHYHANRVTARWAEYVKGVQSVATRSVAERERVDAQRKREAAHDEQTHQSP